MVLSGTGALHLGIHQRKTFLVQNLFTAVHLCIPYSQKVSNFDLSATKKKKKKSLLESTCYKNQVSDLKFIIKLHSILTASSYIAAHDVGLGFLRTLCANTVMSRVIS